MSPVWSSANGEVKFINEQKSKVRLTKMLTNTLNDSQYQTWEDSLLIKVQNEVGLRTVKKQRPGQHTLKTKMSISRRSEFKRWDDDDSEDDRCSTQWKYDEDGPGSRYGTDRPGSSTKYSHDEIVLMKEIEKQVQLERSGIRMYEPNEHYNSAPDTHSQHGNSWNERHFRKNIDECNYKAYSQYHQGDERSQEFRSSWNMNTNNMQLSPVQENNPFNEKHLRKPALYINRGFINNSKVTCNNVEDLYAETSREYSRNTISRDEEYERQSRKRSQDSMGFINNEKVTYNKAEDVSAQTRRECSRNTISRDEEEYERQSRKRSQDSMGFINNEKVTYNKAEDVSAQTRRECSRNTISRDEEYERQSRKRSQDSMGFINNEKVTYNKTEDVSAQTRRECSRNTISRDEEEYERQSRKRHHVEYCRTLPEKKGRYLDYAELEPHYIQERNYTTQKSQTITTHKDEDRIQFIETQRGISNNEIRLRLKPEFIEPPTQVGNKERRINPKCVSMVNNVSFQIKNCRAVSERREREELLKLGYNNFFCESFGGESESEMQSNLDLSYLPHLSKDNIYPGTSLIKSFPFKNGKRFDQGKSNNHEEILSTNVKQRQEKTHMQSRFKDPQNGYNSELIFTDCKSKSLQVPHSRIIDVVKDTYIQNCDMPKTLPIQPQTKREIRCVKPLTYDLVSDLGMLETFGQSISPFEEKTEKKAPLSRLTQVNKNLSSDKEVTQLKEISKQCVSISKTKARTNTVNISNCPVDGCSGISPDEMKKHAYSVHFPAILSDTTKSKPKPFDPDLMIKVLRQVAAWILKGSPGLDRLVRFFNQGKKLPSIDITDYLKDMRAFCLHNGWTIPYSFTTKPINSIAVLIHWRVLLYCVSYMTDKQRTMFRAFVVKSKHVSSIHVDPIKKKDQSKLKDVNTMTHSKTSHGKNIKEHVQGTDSSEVKSKKGKVDIQKRRTSLKENRLNGENTRDKEQIKPKNEILKESMQASNYREECSKMRTNFAKKKKDHLTEKRHVQSIAKAIAKAVSIDIAVDQNDTENKCSNVNRLHTQERGENLTKQSINKESNKVIISIECENEKDTIKECRGRDKTLLDRNQNENLLAEKKLHEHNSHHESGGKGSDETDIYKQTKAVPENVLVSKQRSDEVVKSILDDTLDNGMKTPGITISPAKLNKSVPDCGMKHKPEELVCKTNTVGGIIEFDAFEANTMGENVVRKANIDEKGECTTVSKDINHPASRCDTNVKKLDGKCKLIHETGDCNVTYGDIECPEENSTIDEKMGSAGDYNEPASVLNGSQNEVRKDKDAKEKITPSGIFENDQVGRTVIETVHALLIKCCEAQNMRHSNANNEATIENEDHMGKEGLKHDMSSNDGHFGLNFKDQLANLEEYASAEKDIINIEPIGAKTDCIVSNNGANESCKSDTDTSKTLGTKIDLQPYSPSFPCNSDEDLESLKDEIVDPKTFPEKTVQDSSQEHTEKCEDPVGVEHLDSRKFLLSDCRKSNEKHASMLRTKLSTSRFKTVHTRHLIASVKKKKASTISQGSVKDKTNLELNQENSTTKVKDIKDKQVRQDLEWDNKNEANIKPCENDTESFIVYICPCGKIDTDHDVVMDHFIDHGAIGTVDVVDINKDKLSFNGRLLQIESPIVLEISDDEESRCDESCMENQTKLCSDQIDGSGEIATVKPIEHSVPTASNKVSAIALLNEQIKEDIEVRKKKPKTPISPIRFYKKTTDCTKMYRKCTELKDKLKRNLKRIKEHLVWADGKSCPVPRCHGELVKFPNFSAFDKHWKLYHVPVLVHKTCDVCGETSKRKYNMKQHVQMEHDGEAYLLTETTPNKYFIDPGEVQKYITEREWMH